MIRVMNAQVAGEVKAVVGHTVNVTLFIPTGVKLDDATIAEAIKGIDATPQPAAIPAPPTARRFGRGDWVKYQGPKGVKSFKVVAVSQPTATRPTTRLGLTWHAHGTVAKFWVDADKCW